MTLRKTTRTLPAWPLAICLFALVVLSDRPVDAQLFESLKSFEARLPLGYRDEPWWGGPKGIASGDLNGDGAPDIAVSDVSGGISVFLSAPDGKLGDPRLLESDAISLREIVIADLTNDGWPDIASAAVYDERVVIFANDGQGDFGEPRALATPSHDEPPEDCVDNGDDDDDDDGDSGDPCAPRFFSRNLCTGDFDGDGITDLVVGGSGNGLREFRGTAAGELVEIGDLRPLDAAGTSKPVYSIRRFRRAGQDRDSLVVTHAWSSKAWVLSQSEPGAPLRESGEVIGTEGVYYLEVGTVTSAAADEDQIDLVTAHRNIGIIQVRKGTASGFASTVHQQIAVPGGPRAVKIVDLDGDGWNDLVVVLRNLDRVLTYRNENGVFVPGSEMPVGNSPRDIAVADFNGDDELDIAVINRSSFDVSVLPGRPGEVGFSVLDQTYLVDGEVVDLQVANLDEEGGDEIIQLHRSSGEISVWTMGDDGRLAAPTFYAMGTLPTSLDLQDVNADGVLDAVTANLGREEGSMAVRLGDGDGGFGPLLEIPTLAGRLSRMFSLRMGDFDRDGFTDAAAGFLDCRLALLRGKPDGGFELARVDEFIYEARAMVVGDFDQDGDLDLAGGSFTGDVVVVTNRNGLLDEPSLERRIYPSPDTSKFGTRDMKAEDVNGDGDLDLVLASGHGVLIYHGGPGMAFQVPAVEVPGTEFPTSSVILHDFDGDGQEDIAVSCEVFACIIILTQVDGKFRPALSVDVPAGKILAMGDFDGDGFTDLAGSGEVLWVALSSRPAASGAPPVLWDTRATLDRVVINEILAINNDVPLEFDEMRKPDWAEIFNGTDEPVSLNGWHIELVKTDDSGLEEIKAFPFPLDTVLAPAGRAVVVFSNNKRSPFHAGFRLPGSGGTLKIFDSRNEVVDEVTYDEQLDNISFARFKDAHANFVFNPFPNAGTRNVDNGTVPATVELEHVEFERIDGLTRLRVFARARDDIGILTLSALLRESPTPESPVPEVRRVILYDDGFHGDGEALDGRFAGDRVSQDPVDSTTYELFLDAEDLSGNRTTVPDGFSFVPSGDLTEPFRLVYRPGEPVPSIAVSEVVALNENVLHDETGGTPDYVELRNCSSEPIRLSDYAIATSYPAAEWLELPDDIVGPGEVRIVFCDGNADQGEWHAPFTLRAGGDRVVVLRDAGRDYEVVDRVSFDALAADTAWARADCGGEWGVARPTPGTINSSSIPVGDVDASGGVNLTDAVVILNYLFAGSAITCSDAADVNQDGGVDLSDAVRILEFLFRGGVAIPATSVDCGI